MDTNIVFLDSLNNDLIRESRSEIAITIKSYLDCSHSLTISSFVFPVLVGYLVLTACPSGAQVTGQPETTVLNKTTIPFNQTIVSAREANQTTGQQQQGQQQQQTNNATSS